MIGADYISTALADARVVELRVPTGERWLSGTFDAAGPLRDAVEAHASRNCYLTINRPGGVVASNRMGVRALGDDDIERVVRLPFDFDPERPTGTASTNSEMASAMRRRDSMVAGLMACGWPRPATGASGNGAHALHRCLLPATAETREMLAAIYAGLAHDYSDAAVHFDPTVRNPSRIWRLYGTVNRKGVSTNERPHRLASITIPARWDGVSPQQIAALANRYARDNQPRKGSAPLLRATVSAIGSGDFTTLDAPGWFSTHGAYKRRLPDGKHAVTCPWSGEHSTEDAPHGTDTVIWDADPGRWPSFHCSHAHCDGRSIVDVMRLWGDADAYCARAWRRATA